MAVSLLRTLPILVAIVGTLICGGDVVSAQCGGSVPNLIARCSRFVRGSGQLMPPDAACCSVVKRFDLKCGCHLITKAVAHLVNVPKAIYVARYCGLNLPAGTKCGGK
ncbi:hypothetical protein K1719_011220 [Acacia pycnantha]|nr:hypothetical protein K1719_043184 [Acacia pycnantha]KAI9117805.1 hypothetical protein K1719_011220 [Acacia pycnantha]